MSPALLILLSIGLPLVAAVVIMTLDRYPDIREGVTLTTAALLGLILWQLLGHWQAGASGALVLAEPLPQLPLAFTLEPLGLLFAVVASSLWLVTSIYAIGYMRGHHETHQTRFYAAFAIAIASVMLMVFAANLFTLFIGYELLTLSTYPLVTHAGTAEARRSGRVYLGILMGTSIGLFLLAMLITWQVAGTLDFTAGGILAGKLDPSWAIGLYLLFILGVGKAAVMPLHGWLPAAMVAPTPVSALLHAVAVVKAGVFTVLKITLYIFGPDFIQASGANAWIIWLPAITILAASLIALTRDNLKERLAYSTVSQLSYIVLGAMLANEMGLLGGALHITMHAFAKITLFFAAGAILVAAHKTRVSELDGLGRAMPITFTAFLLASLSIIGLPPFGGMWSKWYLGLGTVAAEQWLLLAVLLLSSLLNIAYLLIIPVRAFFKQPPAEQTPGLHEAPWTCLLGMSVPALMCVVLFFYPEPFYSLAKAL